MSTRPSWSIRSRLLASLLLACTCLAAMAAWGLWSARSGISTTAALFDRATAATQQALNLRAAVGELRRLEISAIAIGPSNATEVQRLRELWKKQAAALDTAAGRLGSDDAALATLGAQLRTGLAAYLQAVDPILEQIEGARIDAPVALAYAEQQADKVESLLRTTAEIVKVQDTALGSIRSEMAAGSMRQAYLQLGAVGLTLALLVPLMLLTTRSIVRPLMQAVAAARRMAGGDLSGPAMAEQTTRDEAGQLLQALSDMRHSLGHLVGQVRTAADSIHVASSEVATGNQDLSQRTERTASSLQQAAGAMEQLAGTVGRSVDAAGQARELAASAAAVASRGGQVVAEVVSTMDEINQSSHRIADISGVIDGIAFQTNILALNAAVEAARAGEQGRGFAVVAGEVRSLAQRSAEAAKEIKSLIDASVSRVQRGADLVGNAGRTMDEIVRGVQHVSSMIGEIASTAGEQSGGIGEVSSSVAVVDQMTQQNAALVEQSAAAAESLEQQARTLAQLVATFRIDAAEAAPAATR